jgi:hypothetical protein
VRVLFADDAHDRDKFEAENEIERIQKSLDAAQKKQFEFREFLEAQKNWFEETFRARIDAAREKYIALNIGVDRSTPRSKLTYKVRSKIFADSDVGPFCQTSSSTLRFWWSVIDRDTTQIEFMLKIQEVRKAVAQVWESKDPQKLGIGCLFYFSIPYDIVVMWGGDLLNQWMQFVLRRHPPSSFTPKPNNFFAT